MPLHAVRLEQADSRPLAVIRRHVRLEELPRAVPEGCGLAWNALRAQGIRGGRHVALYWDSTIRLEVGVEVLTPFVPQGQVVASETPRGTVASTTHRGPYGTLNQAHEAIHVWCHEHGHKLAGPRWEIYGHWQPEWDSKPSLIETEVIYLLA